MVREDALLGVVAALRREEPEADESQVREVVAFWWRMLGGVSGTTAEQITERSRDTLRLRRDLTGPRPSEVEWAEELVGDLALAMARLDELRAAGWLVLSVTALTAERDHWRLLLAAPL